MKSIRQCAEDLARQIENIPKGTRETKAQLEQVLGEITKQPPRVAAALMYYTMHYLSDDFCCNVFINHVTASLPTECVQD